MHQTCLGLVWALYSNFHSLPQFALNPDKMRVLVAVFMLALSLGYSFRVEDVFDIFQAGTNILRQNEMIMDPKIGVQGRKCVNLGSLRSLNCFIYFLLKMRVFNCESSSSTIYNVCLSVCLSVTKVEIHLLIVHQANQSTV